MRAKCIIALSLAFATLSVDLLRADCLDFSRATSWSVQDEEKIVFYQGLVPFAVITLQSCRAASNSDIRLTKAYMCDEDKIVVDGEQCNIMSIDRLH